MDEPKDADSIEEIIEYFQSLPSDSIVQWGDWRGDQPYRSGWVDVYIPTICERYHQNWVWTILDPHEIEDEAQTTALCPWEIGLTPNITIHGLWDTKANWWTQDIVLPHNAMPPDAFQRLPGYGSRLGWTVEAISQELNAWVFLHTGRLDISLQWSPHITPELTQNRDNPEEEYVVHYDPETNKEIRVTSSVMDQLLADPDLGSLVIEKLKKILEMPESSGIFTQLPDEVRTRVEEIIRAHLAVNPSEEGLQQAAYEINNIVLTDKTVALTFSDAGDVIITVHNDREE